MVTRSSPIVVCNSATVAHGFGEGLGRTRKRGFMFAVIAELSYMLPVSLPVWLPSSHLDFCL